MPATPYAQLQVRRNSGAIQTGAITAKAGDTIALSLAATQGVQTALWEIYSYPPSGGFPLPSGWSNASSGRAYQVTTAGGASPPSFSLSSLPVWGKYLLRVTVNNGLRNGIFDPTLVDESTALSVPSPQGLVDVLPFETNQFSSDGGWADGLQQNWRVIGSGATGDRKSVV